MEHFKKEKNEISVFSMILLSFLHIFTLGATWFFAYEMWAEPHYWKNRWKLHRLLKAGKVKVKYLRRALVADTIETYELDIEGESYSVWIWDKKYMTLDAHVLHNTDYIGMFMGSLTTKWLNRVAIRKITQLAEHNLTEIKPSQELTHVNFGNEKVHLDNNVIR